MNCSLKPVIPYITHEVQMCVADGKKTVDGLMAQPFRMGRVGFGRHYKTNISGMQEVSIFC